MSALMPVRIIVLRWLAVLLLASVLVGPAHTAVVRSARALAHAAVQHTPKEAP